MQGHGGRVRAANEKPEGEESVPESSHQRAIRVTTRPCVKPTHRFGAARASTPVSYLLLTFKRIGRRLSPIERPEETMPERPELLQGTLDLIVLKLLRAGPANGWDMTQSIQLVSKGALDGAAGATLIARVSTGERIARAAIDAALSATDSIAFDDLHTMESSLALQRYPFFAAYWVASLVGGIALVLTLTGVYGVLSYVVAQRTREFGMRLALGASPRRLVGLGQLVRLSLVGAGVGVLVAAPAAAFAGSIFDAVDTRDPIGFAIGVDVVLGSCACAAIVPSRRAASVNPVKALRAE